MPSEEVEVRLGSQIIAAVAALALIGCVTGTVQSASWNPLFVHSGPATYAWLPDAETDSSGVKSDPTVDRWIRSAIDTDLQGKGLGTADLGTADFAVGYQLTTYDGVSQKLTGSAWNDLGWGTSGWGAGGSAPLDVDRSAGTLVVLIFEVDTKELVWRGDNAMVPLRADTTAREQAVGETVTQLLEKFPPSGQINVMR